VKFERIVESIAKLGLKKPITVTVGKPGDDGVETFDLVCGQGTVRSVPSARTNGDSRARARLSKTDGLLASLIEKHRPPSRAFARPDSK